MSHNWGARSFALALAFAPPAAVSVIIAILALVPTDAVRSIDVRFATAGEALTLLDGTRLTLGPDVLVIADGKGPVGLAGIMGAKRTADLIPLCHPLPITAVTVELTPDPAGNAVEIAATVRTTGQTGVEMEALTAASVAALTVYDMCKAVDRSMRIEGVRVTHKAGGKSGDFTQP